MKSQITNGNLVITIPLQAPTRSATGKTLIVASSGMGSYDPALKDPATGKPIKINLNAYVKADTAA